MLRTPSPRDSISVALGKLIQRGRKGSQIISCNKGGRQSKQQRLLLSSKENHQRMRWFDGITNSMDMSLIKLREMTRTRKPSMLQSVDHKESDMIWRLNNNDNQRSS